MGRKSKAKGRLGEQEVAQIIRDQLPHLSVHRNWMLQAAEGGADIVGVPGWAIEVKRAKVARIGDWWTQAAVQAQRAGERPVLIYRLDRQEWQAMMSLYDLRPDLGDHHQVTMPLESWIKLVRVEELDALA